MSKMDQKLFETVASIKTPVFAGFDTETGVADTVIGYHKCESCDSHVILNCLNAPACPVCAGALVLVSEDTNTELKASDFKNLEKLCSCDTCSTTWNAKNDTVAKLKGETIHCMACTSPIVVKADDEDSSTNDNGSDTKNTSSDDTKSNDKSNTDDATEADKELDEALKKLGVKDSEDKKDDSVKTNDKVESEEIDSHYKKENAMKHVEKYRKGEKLTEEEMEEMNHFKPSALLEGKTDKDDDYKPSYHLRKEKEAKNNKSDKVESSDDEDEDQDENENENEDEDEELDASELVYHIALKNIKSAELLHSSEYNNWYMFSDKSPIAVASFENADNTVKNIFRSDEYSTAFTAAVASDGINPELMKDFGFKPIKVDVSIDKLSQELIKEKVDEKTKETNDKLSALSEMFDQSLGTAAMGMVKGFYENDGGFREGLIAQFSSVRARDPEALVEGFLNKHLPDLMRSVVITAKELMNKSPEALNEVSAMVDSAKPRAFVKSKPEIPAIAIHSQLETSSEKPDNRNLNKEKVAASTNSVVDRLFSGVKDKTVISRN